MPHVQSVVTTRTGSFSLDMHTDAAYPCRKEGLSTSSPFRANSGALVCLSRQTSEKQEACYYVQYSPTNGRSHANGYRTRQQDRVKSHFLHHPILAPSEHEVPTDDRRPAVTRD